MYTFYASLPPFIKYTLQNVLNTFGGLGHKLDSFSLASEVLARPILTQLRIVKTKLNSMQKIFGKFTYLDTIENCQKFYGKDIWRGHLSKHRCTGSSPPVGSSSDTFWKLRLIFLEGEQFKM